MIGRIIFLVLLCSCYGKTLSFDRSFFLNEEIPLIYEVDFNYKFIKNVNISYQLDPTIKINSSYKILDNKILVKGYMTTKMAGEYKGKVVISFIGSNRAFSPFNKGKLIRKEYAIDDFIIKNHTVAKNSLFTNLIGDYKLEFFLKHIKDDLYHIVIRVNGDVKDFNYNLFDKLKLGQISSPIIRGQGKNNLISFPIIFTKSKYLLEEFDISHYSLVNNEYIYTKINKIPLPFLPYDSFQKESFFFLSKLELIVLVSLFGSIFMLFYSITFLRKKSLTSKKQLLSNRASLLSNEELLGFVEQHIIPFADKNNYTNTTFKTEVNRIKSWQYSDKKASITGSKLAKIILTLQVFLCCSFNYQKSNINDAIVFYENKAFEYKNNAEIYYNLAVLHEASNNDIVAKGYYYKAHLLKLDNENIKSQIDESLVSIKPKTVLIVALSILFIFLIIKVFFKRALYSLLILFFLSIFFYGYLCFSFEAKGIMLNDVGFLKKGDIFSYKKDKGAFVIVELQGKDFLLDKKDFFSIINLDREF